jgi:hypothetical protein
MTIVNKDHKFIDLLIKHFGLLTADRKIAVRGFFKTLKYDVKWKFAEVIKSQKEILKWFVQANAIKDNEMENYILTEKDFPPHMVE